MHDIDIIQDQYESLVCAVSVENLGWLSKNTGSWMKVLHPTHLHLPTFKVQLDSACHYSKVARFGTIVPV